jgi:hypothetical protein
MLGLGLGLGLAVEPWVSLFRANNILALLFAVLYSARLGSYFTLALPLHSHKPWNFRNHDFPTATLAWCRQY